MPKARKSTQVPAQAQPKEAPEKKVTSSKPQKVPTGATMKFTIEFEEEAAGEDKKKKRARTTTAKVLGKPSMMRYLSMLSATIPYKKPTTSIAGSTKSLAYLNASMVAP